MLKVLGLTMLVSVAAFGQDAKPVIDNDRVTVWDVTWTYGQKNPARGHQRDAVVMWVAGGDIRTVAQGIVERHAREAFFSPKTDSREEQGVAAGSGVGGTPRSVIVELKDHFVPPIQGKSGYPNAFPRPHSNKLLENDRVVVWSYRWNPGEPTPMHFHDKDVIVVYLEDTALTSTTPGGGKTANEYKAFDIRFNKRDRTHTELLIRGQGSAMMTELK